LIADARLLKNQVLELKDGNLSTRWAALVRLNRSESSHG
jgi:hypothetical protein